MATEQSLIPLYINGQFYQATSQQTFRTINPATGESISEVQIASEADINYAVDCAHIAQAKWANVTTIERAKILLQAVAILRQRNDELAYLETLDTGKPLAETSTVDIATGADVLEFFAHAAVTLAGIQQPLRADAFFYTRREPLGVCAAIGAWNYPIQIALWKSAPALAAGNAVIFKPSEITPLTATKLAEIYTEAGLPAGLFNVVQGSGAKIGSLITNHPYIDKISFTGAVSTGKKVMAAAASSTLKDVTMELGGKSPLIIFADADLERAVDIAMMGNFFSSGQVCTNGTRVFVQREIQSQLEQLLLEKMQYIRIGNPLDKNVNFGPVISQEQLNKIDHYFTLAKKQHAHLLTGGSRLTEGELAKGFYVAPTIYNQCTDDMAIVQEEIFGPVMAILTFIDEDEVIKRANATSYGLAAGVITQDLNRAHRVIHQLDAGICWLNSWGESPAAMPVGGFKESGIGFENGVETLQHFTRLKSILVDMGNYKSVFA